MSENEPRREDLPEHTGAPGDGETSTAPSDAAGGEAEPKNEADAPAADATRTQDDDEPKAAPDDEAAAPDEPEAPDDEAPADETSADEDGTGRKGRERQRKVRSRRQRILRRTVAGLAVLVLLAGAGAVALYHDIMGGIEQKDAEGHLGVNRPPKLNKSLNILLIGSDSRDGANARYGAAAGMSGARSDTTMLLHLSPNRDQAVGVSFPRDSMVRIPDCKKEKGGTVPGRFGMLNTAFAFAGPTCTWKTLESLTGIHIDHFVQVDFTGFKRMVDALDGVEICVDRPVNDPRAELYLKAGKQTVKGEDALGYVRARYSLGNGSDLERIERQQKFMASVVNKATSSEVLTDPAKTYKFLKAVSKSITTDDELDRGAMLKLAEGLRGMSAGQVRFVTVPVKRYGPDPNRVQWDTDQAGLLFDAIKRDNDLPAEPAKPVAEQQPPPPEKVKVTVVDAGAPDKLVRRIVTQLKRRGFTVVGKVGKAPDAGENRIAHSAAAEAQATALARAVPDALLTPDAKAPADGVRLIIGKPGVRMAPPPIANINGGVKAGRNPCK
ncbi:LCP family protein [Actinomadura sp. SCN-SB]|uniref:LCP family protein n=1 Tax=Actinomadura sp. SCN-SB TaxID=3373092 RepID=UPI003752396A